MNTISKRLESIASVGLRATLAFLVSLPIYALGRPSHWGLLFAVPVACFLFTVTKPWR